MYFVFRFLMMSLWRWNVEKMTSLQSVFLAFTFFIRRSVLVALLQTLRVINSNTLSFHFLLLIILFLQAQPPGSAGDHWTPRPSASNKWEAAPKAPISCRWTASKSPEKISKRNIFSLSVRLVTVPYACYAFTCLSRKIL